MISEFQDLSDKIDRLAALTQELRRENASLREANKSLQLTNLAYMSRLAEATRRVQALLDQMPPEQPETAAPVVEGGEPRLEGAAPEVQPAQHGATAEASKQEGGTP